MWPTNFFQGSLARSHRRKSRRKTHNTASSQKPDTRTRAMGTQVRAGGFGAAAMHGRRQWGHAPPCPYRTPPGPACGPSPGTGECDKKPWGDFWVSNLHPQGQPDLPTTFSEPRRRERKPCEMPETLQACSRPPRSHVKFAQECIF